MINTIGYWFLESLEGIKKNRKTFFIGLGTMIAVLCIIGALYILNINANSFMNNIRADESKVNIFIKDLDEEKVSIAMGELFKIKGVKNVEYIDKKQSFEKAKAIMPEYVDGYTSDDAAVPTSFVLTIDGDEKISAKQIENEINSISALKGAVDEIKGTDTTEKTIKIAKTVKIVTVTVLFLITVLGCFLMMNSIKLALYARRKEISIMKYVGATDRFTRAPFIIEGLIIALVAAGITLLITNFTYNGVINMASGSQLFSFVVSKDEVFASLSILLLVVSTLIGTIGSAISISKYLDV